MGFLPFFNINWKTIIICEAHEKHIFHLRGQHVWWGEKKREKELSHACTRLNLRKEEDHFASPALK